MKKAFYFSEKLDAFVGKCVVTATSPRCYLIKAIYLKEDCTFVIFYETTLNPRRSCSLYNIIFVVEFKCKWTNESNDTSNLFF